MAACRYVSVNRIVCTVFRCYRITGICSGYCDDFADHGNLPPDQAAALNFWKNFKIKCINDKYVRHTTECKVPAILYGGKEHTKNSGGMHMSKNDTNKTGNSQNESQKNQNQNSNKNSSENSKNSNNY